MKTLNEYPKKLYIGKHDHECIYLTSPSWDCNWYWGFGYLGNKNCHYHVNGLAERENINLFDAFKKHFGESLIIKNDNDLWKICELFDTFYTLRKTAELFGRGGSNYTENPCKELLIDKILVTKINEVLIPNVIDEIYKILLSYKEYEELM